jgi:putative oxidoreductase
MNELMTFLETNTGVLAYTVVRIILGVLFFFQAYDKIFKIKLVNVVKEISSGSKSKHLPKGLIELSVYSSSYLELIGGLFLILGLFTLPVLYLLGIHIVIVSFAFSYLDPVWDTKLVFSRLILLLLLILSPLIFNVISLDFLFF